MNKRAKQIVLAATGILALSGLQSVSVTNQGARLTPFLSAAPDADEFTPTSRQRVQHDRGLRQGDLRPARKPRGGG